MPTFGYLAAKLTELERTLSRDRLLPYQVSVCGNLELAVRLYEQNTLLSESLYGILQGLEVALRNTIHSQFAADYGHAEWYDALQLEPE